MVKAYNRYGESAYSNVRSYTMPIAGDTTPPLPPGGVEGQVNDDSVLITWDASTDADISGYRVYHGTASRDYSLPIPVTDTEYLFSGLNRDAVHYFAVAAVDTSGNESGFSSPELVKTLTLDSEAPLLRWEASSGEVYGYRIYYGTGEGDYTQDVDVGDVTHYAIENLQLDSGATYYFVVRAYNSYGEGEASNAVSYSTGEPADTTAPVVTIASPTTSAVFGTQSSLVNISGISSDDTGVSQVTWSNSRGGSGTTIGTTSWSVADIRLAEGENVITITARDAAGNTATDTLTVQYTLPEVFDTLAPVLQLQSPTTGGFYFTRSSSVVLSGTASDNEGIESITWSVAGGPSGRAEGTLNWKTADIALKQWWNNITITAEDFSGNQTSHNLTIFSWSRN